MRLIVPTDWRGPKSSLSQVSWSQGNQSQHEACANKVKFLVSLQGQFGLFQASAFEGPEAAERRRSCPSVALMAEHPPTAVISWMALVPVFGPCGQT